MNDIEIAHGTWDWVCSKVRHSSPEYTAMSAGWFIKIKGSIPDESLGDLCLKSYGLTVDNGVIRR